MQTYKYINKDGHVVQIQDKKEKSNVVKVYTALLNKNINPDAYTSTKYDLHEHRLKVIVNCPYQDGHLQLMECPLLEIPKNQEKVYEDLPVKKDTIIFITEALVHKIELITKTKESSLSQYIHKKFLEPRKLYTNFIAEFIQGCFLILSSIIKDDNSKIITSKKIRKSIRYFFKIVFHAISKKGNYKNWRSILQQSLGLVIQSTKKITFMDTDTEFVEIEETSQGILIPIWRQVIDTLSLVRITVIKASATFAVGYFLTNPREMKYFFNYFTLLISDKIFDLIYFCKNLAMM